MKQDRTIPGAILLGSIIIAAGLYFGLRKDEPATDQGVGAEVATGPSKPVTPPRSTGGLVAAPPAGPPAAALPIGGGLGMAPVAPELRAKVEADAAKAFEAERANFRKECWDPAIKKNPEPAKSKFVFNVTFDGATGKEISRGVNELRGESRSDVGQCLRMLPMGVSIEPPGANVNVDVPITFP